MSRPDWSDYFHAIARTIATRATCPRRQVGAVLVRDNHILSQGYNGSPPGHPHCVQAGCLIENGHCVRVVHAELNALCHAASEGISVKGATLYCTLQPCRGCTYALMSAGVNTFKWEEDYPWK